MTTKESQALRVGTWNVRGTNQQGKIQIIAEQMAKSNIEILGMEEAFWKGETIFQIMAATNQERYTVIMKGGEKSRKGVGFIVRKGIEDMLVMTDSKGDSIAGIPLSTKPVETIIIHIYMPTSDCEENVSLAFYEDIEEVIKRFGGRKDRVIIIMGDFNSMIGESQVEEIVGPFSIGERNDKGQSLIDYCKEKSFTIRSTQYQTAKKRRYTWTHPNGINETLINYMLVDKKHRISLCKYRPITNPDCGTDHNMVVGTLKIQRVKQQKKAKPQPKLNVEKLIDNEIRTRYKEIADGTMRNAETW